MDLSSLSHLVLFVSIAPLLLIFVDIPHGLDCCTEDSLVHCQYIILLTESHNFPIFFGRFFVSVSFLANGPVASWQLVYSNSPLLLAQ